jgi:hypothetical protein
MPNRRGAGHAAAGALDDKADHEERRAVALCNAADRVESQYLARSLFREATIAATRAQAVRERAQRLRALAFESSSRSRSRRRVRPAG